MTDYHFVVERPGIHTTFQDSGYEHLQHFGITTGGVVDNNLFKIANKLLDNNLNETIIEFAYQGPRLRLEKGNACIVITGDVHFMISKQSEDFIEKPGETFKTYQLNEGDIVDILATKSSVYGYCGVEGGFNINKYKLCIISNGDSKFQRLKLTKTGLERYFSEILISGDIKIKKPNSKIYQTMSDKINIPLYPIIGVGSVPFRGNFSPHNVDRVINEYPGIHTFTIQSSFKYHHPTQSLNRQIKKIENRITLKSRTFDEAIYNKLIKKYTAQYQEDLEKITNLVSVIAPLIPNRRARRIHVGLFGYSREISNPKQKNRIILPRAITFCASLYSIGICLLYTSPSPRDRG